MLEQASPVLLYHTWYTLYIIQISTRVRCSEARSAVFKLYIIQCCMLHSPAQESIAVRNRCCSVAVLQCYSVARSAVLQQASPGLSQWPEGRGPPIGSQLSNYDLFAILQLKSRSCDSAILKNSLCNCPFHILKDKKG